MYEHLVISCHSGKFKVVSVVQSAHVILIQQSTVIQSVLAEPGRPLEQQGAQGKQQCDELI